MSACQCEGCEKKPDAAVVYDINNETKAQRCCRNHAFVLHRLLSDTPEVANCGIAWYLVDDQGSHLSFVKALPVNTRRTLSQALVHVLAEAATHRGRARERNRV